jgi:hypothetical protein
MKRYALLALATLTLAGNLTGCATGPYKQIRVFGLGIIQVPRGATVEEIDQAVIDRYGVKLAWARK